MPDEAELQAVADEEGCLSSRKLFLLTIHCLCLKFSEGCICAGEPLKLHVQACLC